MKAVKTKLIKSPILAVSIACLSWIGTQIAGAESRQQGFGLIAHWAFDEDFSSSVNNDLYQGFPSDPEFVTIGKPADESQIGSGALRLDSGFRSGNQTFVDVRNPLFGHKGYDTFTVTAWYRCEDLSGDGMDQRTFVWESTPTYSLAFGLRSDDAGVRDAEWWFLNQSRAALSDTSGPVIEHGAWNHVAMIWNRPEGRCRFYHNGELRDDMTFDPSIELEWMTGLHIGNHRAGDGTRDWDGWIDDMAVFDLELTARQVQALHRREDSGKTVTAENVLMVVPSPETQFLTARPVGVKAPRPDWDPAKAQGPFIGHLTATSATIWARIPDGGEWTLSLVDDHGNEVVAERSAQSSAENDFCLRWEIGRLAPSTKYHYSIRSSDKEFCSGNDYYFNTAPDLKQPNRTTLVFGSCAGFEDSAVWSQMAKQGADGLVLMGDTPYIDTVDLARVRDAYRRFASIPKLAELIRTRPFWGTWDDHDFGRNDSDGTLPGKEFTRQGFVEYRPNAEHGENGQGIYTSFRQGPVEVFLLDARWFARTEDSWADPNLPTLLGNQQWEWLKAGLLESTAPFKILATGMIWDDKENSESDDWGTYMHERLAIEKWIGDNHISGIILLGGDIHVSRHLIYPESKQRAGYVLHQFITSPVHDGIIPSLNVEHPALVWSAEEPQTFLKITAIDDLQTAQLTASWIKASGEVMNEVKMISEDLEME